MWPKSVWRFMGRKAVLVKNFEFPVFDDQKYVPNYRYNIMFSHSVYTFLGVT